MTGQAASTRNGHHHGYTSMTADDGDNYREIAETMTELGFSMNHSSAHNHVLRVMRKFASAFAEGFDADISEQRVDELARDPEFQHNVSDLLQVVEAHRRRTSRGKTQ